MYGLKKKINGFINASIGVSAIFVALGVLFLFFPETSLDVIRWIITAFCMIAGIYFIAADFSKRKISPFFSTTALGAVLVIVALVFAVYPNVMNIFPIAIGAWFIISALSSLRFATTLKGTGAGSLSIVATVLAFVCGLLLIFNPWGGQISIMVFAGIMMIIYGISNIIQMATIKSNIKDVSETFKQMAKEIDDIPEAKTTTKKEK